MAAENTNCSNFILPKTEESLCKIIQAISSFFDAERFVLICVNFLYALIRLFCYRHFVILNVSLSVLLGATAVLSLLDLRKIVKLKSWLKLVLNLCRRVLSLTVVVLNMWSIFLLCGILSAGADIVPSYSGAFAQSSAGFLIFSIIFSVICLIGIIFSILGDIFNATIPVWTNILLDSFKQDINITQLAVRSISEIKQAVNQNSSFITESAVKATAIGAAGLGLRALRKAIHSKK